MAQGCNRPPRAPLVKKTVTIITSHFRVTNPVNLYSLAKKTWYRLVIAYNSLRSSDMEEKIDNWNGEITGLHKEIKK